MAQTIAPPLGVGIIDSNGYMNRAWVQWFNDVYNNTAEGYVELKSNSLSSSSDIQFTSGINAVYDVYMLVLTDVRASQPGTLMDIRFSEDSGTTYNSGLNYEWVLTSTAGSTTTNDSSTADNSIQLITDTLNNRTGTSLINGTIMLFNPAGTSNYKTISWDLSYENNSDAFTKVQGSGRYKRANAYNAVKMYLNAGLFAEGSVKLYGIK